MKLSLIALAASTAMVSAHDYELPPPAHYPSVEYPPPVHTPTLPPPAHYPSVEYPPPVHTPSLPPPAHYPSVVYPPPPPEHTPSYSHSYSNITLIPTKTIYPPHPPPSTTTIPPPPPEGCPPVKTETVTKWINPPPNPTHPAPEEPETPGEPEEPEEPEEPGESGGEQPPATQSGPETVPTGAAMAGSAPVALLAAGVLAAVAF